VGIILAVIAIVGFISSVIGLISGILDIWDRVFRYDRLKAAQALQLYYLGKFFYEQNQLQNAKECFAAALELFKEIKDKPNIDRTRQALQTITIGKNRKTGNTVQNIAQPKSQRKHRRKRKSR